MRNILILVIAICLHGCGGGSASGSTTAASMQASIPTPEKIALWGDSLTAGGMAAELQSILPSRTIYMGGVGGQTSTQIAARQGSVQPIMTVAGDVIPETGGVLISTRSVDPITDQGGGPLIGTLAGVKGTLTRASDNTYTFTRLSPGNTAVVSPGSAFAADPMGRDSWVTIFWMGQNNYLDQNKVKADIAAAVAFLKAAEKKYVVLSIMNMDIEPIGSSSHTAITLLNSELSALYPNNYLDIRTYLVQQFDPSNSQDVIDHANDVSPSSLRRDGIHMNAAGNKIVAKKVADFISAKGW